MCWVSVSVFAELYMMEGGRLDFVGEILEGHRGWVLDLRRTGKEDPPSPRLCGCQEELENTYHGFLICA